MIEASIILDGWSAPRSREQQHHLIDYLLRVLNRKAEAQSDKRWMPPRLRREHYIDGTVRYILEAREHVPIRLMPMDPP